MQDLKEILISNYFTETETAAAFQLAKQLQLPVFADFWAPNCKGCKKMELTTYQDVDILTYISKHFVVLKYNITNTTIPKITSSPVLWTPTFIVFGNDGSEVRKSTGYLNNEELYAELELGRALACLRKAQPKQAAEILAAFISDTQYKHAIPEALYWSGVASYFMHNRTADSLVLHWERLLNEYPGSSWAGKADCLHISL